MGVPLPSAGVNGYVALPAGWTRGGARGPGGFVTAEVFVAPDGREVRWSSRVHRKASAAAGTGRMSEPVWWRPRQRGWWMAILFSFGSLCFLVGGVASQAAPDGASTIGVVFFTGSLFFTSAAYLQYAEAVNAARDLGARAAQGWRPASWEPRRIDWLSSLIQFAGTLAFNVTTFAAMKHGFSTRQSNVRVWAPDAVGSVAFLVSSELAFAEVCHRWICLRRRSLAWRIAALNLAGSVAFGISAIASYSEPSTGEPLSAHIANSGTALGGLCFLIGALLLMPEAAQAEAGAPSAPPAASGLSSPASEG